MKISFLELKNAEALRYVDELAQLRMKVFAAFPYLYEGDLAYEKKYLQTYFQSKHSFVVLAKDHDRIIGASTAVWLPEAEAAFQKPFIEQKIKIESVCYFGESVLLAEYRGLKIGKKFMELRENFARSLPGVQWASFCAVIRPADHPLKPAEYVPLNGFWQKTGFELQNDMKTEFSWKDIDHKNETPKQMQFWIKKLNSIA